MGNTNIKVSNSDRIRAERDLLIQAFRIEKKNSKGTENKVPKAYFNEKIWIRITDPEIFKALFPVYLHFIAQEIDEWYIFIKKTHKGLINVEEYKVLKQELYKKYETQLLKIAFKNNITSKMIDEMNYFDLIETLKELKIYEEQK